MANPLVAFDSPRKVSNDASNGGETLPATGRWVLGPGLRATLTPANPAPGQPQVLTIDAVGGLGASSVIFRNDADTGDIDGIVKDTGDIIRVGAPASANPSSSDAQQVLIAAKQQIRHTVNNSERLTITEEDLIVGGGEGDPDAAYIRAAAAGVSNFGKSLRLYASPAGSSETACGAIAISTGEVSTGHGDAWTDPPPPIQLFLWPNALGDSGELTLSDGTSTFLGISAPGSSSSTLMMNYRDTLEINSVEDFKVTVGGAPMFHLDDQGWGFNGQPPGTPIITGDTSGTLGDLQAVVQSLLTELDARGAIVNSTT